MVTAKIEDAWSAAPWLTDAELARFRIAHDRILEGTPTEDDLTTFAQLLERARKRSEKADGDFSRTDRMVRFDDLTKRKDMN